MVLRFFTSFPFNVPVSCGLEKLGSILAKNKQASSAPGSNHKEAFKTRDLEVSILYFPLDRGGCDLFLLLDVHFRKAFLFKQKLLQAMNRSFIL